MTPFLHKMPVVLAATCLALALQSLAAHGAGIANPGRLFYTPVQRAKLEAARSQDVSSIGNPRPDATAVAVRYDGLLIRSDGKTMRWADGKAADARSVQGLKPGQLRSEGKVYEPYEVVSPAPFQDSAP
jgi:hypothetical protein